MPTQISRTILDLKPVLLDQNAEGPSIVYIVEPVTEPWVNKTIIQPGRLGKEYTKTFGHYHTVTAKPELYKVEAGEGVLILQKKHVDQVLLVRANAGDTVLITSEYGHSWSNVGTSALVLLDNWAYGHSYEDYAFIKKHKGMAYYLIEDNGKPKPVKNVNYVDTLKPIWATPDQLPQGV